MFRIRTWNWVWTWGTSWSSPCPLLLPPMRFTYVFVYLYLCIYIYVFVSASADEVYMWKLFVFLCNAVVLCRIWLLAFQNISSNYDAQVFKHAKRLGYGEHDVSAVYIRFEHSWLPRIHKFRDLGFHWLQSPLITSSWLQFLSSQGEVLREHARERKYTIYLNLPELNVQGAKIVAVYLCLKKSDQCTERGTILSFWANKHLCSDDHCPVFTILGLCLPKSGIQRFIMYLSNL